MLLHRDIDSVRLSVQLASTIHRYHHLLRPQRVLSDDLCCTPSQIVKMSCCHHKWLESERHDFPARVAPMICWWWNFRMLHCSSHAFFSSTLILLRFLQSPSRLWQLECFLWHRTRIYYMAEVVTMSTVLLTLRIDWTLELPAELAHRDAAVVDMD